jgi:hypothetical protein
MNPMGYNHYDSSGESPRNLPSFWPFNFAGRKSSVLSLVGREIPGRKSLEEIPMS